MTITALPHNDRFLRRALAYFVADARHFQLLALGVLACVSIGWFDFGTRPQNIAVAFAAVLLTQTLFDRRIGRAVEWRSALITGLGLSILLRADSLLWLLAAGVIAISSKFLFRLNGKHIWNPATGAIALLLLLAPDHVWITPGQWGTTVWTVFLMAGLGSLVLARAKRLDTAIVFFVVFTGCLIARMYYLGDPWKILFHQMQSGTLVMFGFFMITDPRSLPDHPLARGFFAAAVALLGWWLITRWQLRPGLIFALAVLAPLSPVLDRLMPATRYQWQS